MRVLSRVVPRWFESEFGDGACKPTRESSAPNGLRVLKGRSWFLCGRLG